MDGRVQQQHAIAIQISGHLRAKCDVSGLHAHATECRQHFSACHLFLHTWTELEPMTPHWRRGQRVHEHVEERALPDASLAEEQKACLAKVFQTLRPKALLLEQQPGPPPPDTAAPDGSRYNLSSEDKRLHYGAAREHGWRMNVHGMAQAARLRRHHPAKEPYVLTVRLRPDDRMALRPSAVRAFWNCVAQLPSFVVNKTHTLLNLSNRVSVLGAARRAPGKELRGRSRELLWLAVSACGPHGGLTAIGNENCLVAQPAVLDELLAQFDGDGYGRTYAGATARHLPHNKPELQLIVAARQIGIGLATACG